MKSSQPLIIIKCVKCKKEVVLSIMTNSLPSILWSGDMAYLPSRDNTFERPPPSFPLFSLTIVLDVVRELDQLAPFQAFSRV